MRDDEWGDAWDDQPTPPQGTRPAPSMFGVDVAGVADEVVAAAVQAAVAKEVSAAAAEAVASVLTDDLRERLREQAEAAAQTAIARQLEQQEAHEAGESETAPTLVYGSVDEWVREWFRFQYRRTIDLDRGTMRWAAKWWQYEEAVTRLESMWRAWEHLRLDASVGMSTWFRDHADPHMAILLSREGPFATVRDSDQTKIKAGDPLPYEAPPAELFPDVRAPKALGARGDGSDT